jgi:GNAT superfamily N-acetyltransferase
MPTMHDYTVVPTDPPRALALAQVHMGYSRDLSSDSDDEVAFGGIRDRALVGVAVMHPEPWLAGIAEAWKISAVVVEPENRRRGLGRLLVEACLDHARDQGAERLWCRSSFEAVAFFEAMDFDSVGETVGDGRTVAMYRKVTAPTRSWAL